MKEFFIGCFGIIIFIFALACFEGWIFMLLWNWLVPMFWITAPILTLWQSIGILLLINIIGKIFFGSKNKD